MPGDDGEGKHKQDRPGDQALPSTKTQKKTS